VLPSILKISANLRAYASGDTLVHDAALRAARRLRVVRVQPAVDARVRERAIEAGQHVERHMHAEEGIALGWEDEQLEARRAELRNEPGQMNKPQG